MSKLYYAKELVSGSAVLDSRGVKIPWEHLGGDYGAIVLDTETDAQLIQDLKNLCGTQGIRASSEGEYRDFFKSLPVHKAHDPRAVIRVFNQPKPKPQPPGAAVVVDNPPMPPLAPMPRIMTPAPALTEEPPKPAVAFKPKTARVGAKKAAAAPATTGG